MDTNIIIFFIDILVMYAVLYAHQETNESLESLFFTGTKSGTPRFFNVLLQMVILVRVIFLLDTFPENIKMTRLNKVYHNVNLQSWLLFN